MAFRRADRLGALALALLAGCTSPSAEGLAPGADRDRGAFAVRLGTDTVAVEEFTRTPGRLTGRQLVLTPRLQVREYTAELEADGSLRRFELVTRAAESTEPESRATVDVQGDSALVSIVRGDSTQTIRVATPNGTVPLLNYSVALYELPLARLGAGASLETALLPIGGRQTIPLRLERISADSVAVTNIAGRNRVRAREDGRLLAWNGDGTTLQLRAERVASLDFDRLTRAYAARDRAGRGLGTLSPRDSVAAVIDGARVSVAYGRPLRRGRTIFGNVVPWGQVWRTGANQATHFHTDRDLVIGGATVPAGRYSLFTLPSQEGWKLIINRQTGQWGTQYDASQDLARVDLTRRSTIEPVDQFTIRFEARPEGGALLLAWDDTELSVPMAVR